MKKQEAQELAIDKSKEMIGYLEQFLSGEKITGKMIFRTKKIEGEPEKMCFVDIMLNNGLKNQINLGIPSVHSDVFTRQFTNDLVDRFAKDETMGVTRYFEIKSMPPISRKGMDAISIFPDTKEKNSHIEMDFYYGGLKFDSIMEEYSNKLEASKELSQEVRIRK